MENRDRPRDPCPDCGEELYDKFWGNGGWAPTEKTTDRMHGPSDCVKRLKASIPTVEALVWVGAVKEEERLRLIHVAKQELLLAAREMELDEPAHEAYMCFISAHNAQLAALHALTEKVLGR